MGKKILIRSGLSPLNEADIARTLAMDLFGGNTGNMIYAYGVYRALMTSEDTVFVPDEYRLRVRDTEWIDENCSMYIIPMADMFRNDSINYMNKVADDIRRLSIPSIIVGIGLRAAKKDLSSDGKILLVKSYPFDEAVKNLMDAALDNSAIVGIRGDITAQYLENLGYIRDKHFMIIGCPSMYGHGLDLKRNDLKLSDDMSIAVNANILTPKKATAFLNGIMNKYKNSYFLPQKIEEVWTLYTGQKYLHDTVNPAYADSISHSFYQEDRVKCFLNARSWHNFLREMDLSVGGRLHGNIAAIQCGVPSIMLPHNGRIFELVDYHKFPAFNAHKVSEDMTLEQLVEQVDFDSMYKVHEANFDRYISFLDMNGVDHIFKEKKIVERAPLDIALDKQEELWRIKSAENISLNEKKGMGEIKSAENISLNEKEVMGEIKSAENISLNEKEGMGEIKSAVNISLEELGERWRELYAAGVADRNSVLADRVDDINRLKQTNSSLKNLNISYADSLNKYRTKTVEGRLFELYRKIRDERRK